MASSLGGLVVHLGLDSVEFISGLTKSEVEARKAMNNISKSMEDLKKQLIGVGLALAGGLSIKGFADMISGAIEAQEKVQLVAERAGLSGESLSKLSRAAKMSRTDLEDVAKMSAKLSKALILGQDGASKEAQVLGALGIKSSEFGRLLEDPVQATFELAKKINELPEGGTKAAAQLIILGKAGGTTSAFLKELSKQTELTATQQQKAIDSAVEYEQSLIQLEINSDKLKRTVANAMLPTLQDVVNVFLKMSTGAGSAREAINGMAQDGSIQEWSRNAALAVATVAESLLTLMKMARAVGGSFEVVGADIQAQIAKWNVPKSRLEAMTRGMSAEDVEKAKQEYAAAVENQNKVLANANKRYEDLWNERGTVLTDALKKQFAMSDAQEKAQRDLPQNEDARDRLAVSANAKLAADKLKAQKELERRVQAAVADGDSKAAKAKLDAQMKEQARIISQEQDFLKERNHYLQASYDDDLIGFREYYAERLRVFNDSQQRIAAAQQEQIELAKKAAKLPGLKPEERIAALEKVAEYEAHAAKTAKDAEVEKFDLARGSQRALRDYIDAVSELDAQMKDLAGDTAAAAGIRFDIANRSLRAKMVNEGDRAGIEDLATARAQVIAREKLNDATRKYGNTMQEVGLAQARVNLEQQSGAITTLDAINKRAEIAKRYIGTLQQEAIAAKQAAAAMAPGPEQEAALLYVKRLELEIDQLKATTEELENTFRAVFVDSFSTALEEVVMGTKSVKDAFKDMEKQIVASITRIAAQNIAESMFGKTGVGGSIPGIFAGLFGSGGGSFLGNLFSGANLAGAGAFAEGGSPRVGRPALVGENGPELFVPRAAGNIIPNDVLMAKRAQRQNNVTINIGVEGSTTRATADQIALRTGLAVRRALARDA